MKMNYFIKNNKTLIVDHKEIHLKFPVDFYDTVKGLEPKICEASNLILVTLDVREAEPKSEDKYRNILAFDKCGNFKWKIQQAIHGETGEPLPTNYQSCQLQEDGNVYAYDPGGLIYQVDSSNGYVTYIGWTRF